MLDAADFCGASQPGQRAAEDCGPDDGAFDRDAQEARCSSAFAHGAQLERLFAKADLENEDAVAYLQQLIERAGLNQALRRAGAVPGDTVVVGEQEFEFS